jgi:bacterioferritin
MKGSAKVLRVLNDCLAAELTAINEYIVHSEMCADWGYSRLAGQVKMEAIEEMRHAEQLIERILYLEGMPNMEKKLSIKIGTTVKEQFSNDLALEYNAVKRLNKGIALTSAESDAGSQELLKTILVDEEKHIEFLEAQLEQIKQMGIQNYLANQAALSAAGGPPA